MSTTYYNLKQKGGAGTVLVPVDEVELAAINAEKEAAIAEVMRLADAYAFAPEDLSPANDSGQVERAALEAALRKALGLTAQTSVDQTPATSATAAPRTE